MRKITISVEAYNRLLQLRKSGESISDVIIREVEKHSLLEKVKKLYGSSKRKTTDEELHETVEKAFEELEK